MTKYAEEQATAWLSWLAGGMKRHGQTVFLIEQLQPSWLRPGWDRFVYTMGSRLAVCLIFGLAYGIGVRGGWESLVFGLTAGAIGGFGAGLIEFYRLPRRGAWRRLDDRRLIVQVAVATTVFFLAGGLGTWRAHLTAGALVSYLTGRAPTVFFGFAILFGLYWGLRAHRRRLGSDVYTAEVLSWSWPHAGKSALIAAAPCLLLLLWVFSRDDIPEWAREWTEEWTFETWKIVQSGVVLFFTLVAVALGGLRDRVREMSTAPNQGIRLSTKNALVAGILGPAIALLEVLVLMPIVKALDESIPWWDIPAFVLYLGLALGLIVALRYGGLAVIQHYLLRSILNSRGDWPWDCIPFLDYAAEELRLLQKVGGGYMFIHRHLLDHFAAMEDGEKTGSEVSPA